MKEVWGCYQKDVLGEGRYCLGGCYSSGLNLAVAQMIVLITIINEQNIKYNLLYI